MNKKNWHFLMVKTDFHHHNNFSYFIAFLFKISDYSNLCSIFNVVLLFFSHILHNLRETWISLVPKKWYFLIKKVYLIFCFWLWLLVHEFWNLFRQNVVMVREFWNLFHIHNNFSYFIDFLLKYFGVLHLYILFLLLCFFF